LCCICNTVINVNLTAIDTKCYSDSNGIISANVTGGATPYTYKWSTGATASGIALLKPGSYNLTVTDDKGCKGYGSTTVNQPDPIEISHTYVNETYDLLIDTLTVDSVVVNTFTMDSLVYDSLGMVIDTLTVDSLVMSTVQVDSLVIDTLVYDGSANVSVLGGNGVYTYNWSTGATTNNISNVPAGNYEIMVSDQNACMVSKTITIQPHTCSSLIASLDKNNGSCTSDGSITAIQLFME